MAGICCSTHAVQCSTGTAPILITSLHRVTIEDAEETLLDRHRIFDQANLTDEPRWAVIGATEAARVLFVVLTRRGPLLRVVTARDALSRERRRYRR
jgi:uncharacterized DUF497 family protein